MVNLARAVSVIRKNGATGTVAKLYARVRPRRSLTAKRYLPRLDGRHGLEIGGPSRIFNSWGAIPVYHRSVTLDNVTYSDETVWEGKLTAGQTFRFSAGSPAGEQFFLEASDLRPIAPAQYEFLISSHVLEHCANAIKTLNVWKRVVCPDGLFIVVLPDQRQIFDRFRPTTTLDHFMDDFNKDIDETDLTHVEEAVMLTDYTRLLGPKDPPHPQALKEFALKNYHNRRLHHHTFTLESGAKLFDNVGFNILEREALPPHLIFVLENRKPN